MTADTITPEYLDGFSKLLESSSSKIHRLKLQSTIGEITPKDAASAVNAVLEEIRTFRVGEARYFRVDDMIYKFETGKPAMFRMESDKAWDRSAYNSLEQFLRTPGDYTEINAEEGEPS